MLNRCAVGNRRSTVDVRGVLRAARKAIFDLAGPGTDLLGSELSTGLFHARVRRDEQRRVYGYHWRNRFGKDHACSPPPARARSEHQCRAYLEYAARAKGVAAVGHDVAQSALR